MKIIGIYVIENTANGKLYIGSSVDVQQRFRRHRSDLRQGKHHNAHLQAAWNKYGEAAFQFKLMCDVDCASDLVEMEQWHIDKYSPAYNVVQVVDAGCRGRKLTEEHKDKIRAKAVGMRGRKHTAESRKLMAEAKRGTTISQEAKDKISKALTGRKKSPEHCEAISKGKRELA